MMTTKCNKGGEKMRRKKKDTKMATKIINRTITNQNKILTAKTISKNKIREIIRTRVLKMISNSQTIVVNKNLLINQ